MIWKAKVVDTPSGRSYWEARRRYDNRPSS